MRPGQVVDFERGMIQLAAVTGNDLETLTAAFKNWASSTMFPWPFALDYCLQQAINGRPLPFDCKDSVAGIRAELARMPHEPVSTTEQKLIEICNRLAAQLQRVEQKVNENKDG